MYAFTQVKEKEESNRHLRRQHLLCEGIPSGDVSEIVF